MIRTVTATRYVTPLRQGGSLPALVEADDESLYVSKFAGTGPCRPSTAGCARTLRWLWTTFSRKWSNRAGQALVSQPTKADYLLDPANHFLNHGSFGACPRPVFEAYQRWQVGLERQPVEFLGRRAADLLAESRAALAAFLGVAADDVVYFPNPTTAINMVARNVARLSSCAKKDAATRSAPEVTQSPMRLQPGDEILTTDHEYGALDRTWRYVCDRIGARYVQRAIPLPVTTPADFVEHFWAGVTGRTRIIFISHITSPTALTFPVAEICRRARTAGILTIVDGAHAPGQLPLDLAALGADIYAGACHKWLSAPKGAAFLFARPAVQRWLEPLVVSWGWEAEQPGTSRFVDWHEWQGTRDLAAYLAVPAAIDFQRTHDWDAVRRRCHALAVATRGRIVELTGLPGICPETWFGQLFAARLPECDVDALKARLYQEHRVEAPLIRWNGRPFIRVSFQAYNDEEDADALLRGLIRLLPAVAREP
jgi:isopenicillin-N epimerase